MTGVERLQSMINDQEDMALKQTVNYLMTRSDIDAKFLNEKKTLEGMCKFIRSKGSEHYSNGWNYITNEVVYAWAVMYFLLPDEFLKINTDNNTLKVPKPDKSVKNNIVSLDEAKQKIEKKKEVEQLNLFGGTK